MNTEEDKSQAWAEFDPIVEPDEEHPYPPPVPDLEADLAEWSRPQRRRAEHHPVFPTQGFRENLDSLVAGCGSHQAARHAIRWPAGRVTGIDVSATRAFGPEQLRAHHSLTNLQVEHSTSDSFGA